MQITQDTTFQELAALDAFAGFVGKSFLDADIPASIRDVTRAFPDWLPQDIVDGLQHLLDTGARCERLYSPAECAADPALEDVLLFNFTLDRPAPFVLLCAGGAYASVASIVEAFPSAKRFNELGYSAFALQYRVGAPGLREKPLDDLARALQRILARAGETGVDAAGYAVCGFSAGGHLAACWGTDSLGARHYGLPAPAALLLAYPVITMGPSSHELSRQLYLGDLLDAGEAWKRYSPDLLADAAYPPTFLWHCERDAGVVPEVNAVALERALRAQGVPCRRECFPGSAHGWGRAGGTVAAGWIDDAVQFWEKHRGKV